MSKRKGNPYFTNPCRIGCPQPTQSSFEQVVQSLRLSPEQYAESPELRAWVKQNQNDKYVPLDLLATFGFKLGAEV
ncbi:MAG: hypothetical protein WCC04_06860 [Terriglobales bacterium]